MTEQVIRLVNDAFEELDAQLNLRLQKRLKILIMPSRQAFKAKLPPQGHDLTIAFASIGPKDNSIVIDPGSLDLINNNLSSVLKHELWHILIHQAAGQIPLWFNEGVAQWVSEYSVFQDKANELRWAALGNNLIPLDELTNTFPSTSPRIRLAYIQSESVVRFIAARYGPSAIKDIIYYLKNGAGFEEALTKAIRTDVTTIEAAWHKELEPNLLNLFMLAFTQRNIFIIIGILAILAFFMVRWRRKRRLKDMAEEDAWMQSLDSSEWGPTEYEEDEEE